MCTNSPSPSVGLGTFAIVTQDDMDTAIHAALACGYRFFDSSPTYQNEKQLGCALRKFLPQFGLSRKDISITTKNSDMGYKQPMKGNLLETLKKLQTDYVDVFLIHYPMPRTKGYLPSPERNYRIRSAAWKELEAFVDQGLVKEIGVSNFEIRHLEEMKLYAKIMPFVNSLEFHPHLTRLGLVAYCHNKNIRITAHCSMGYQHPDLISELALSRIARVHDATVAQVLLAFALAHGISVIPKSANPDRIQCNWDATAVALTDAEILELEGLDKHRNYTTCTPWNVD